MIPKDLSTHLEARGYQLVESNDRTAIYASENKFLKLFLDKTREARHKNELEFYEKYSSDLIPKFMSSELIDNFPALVLKKVTGGTPGFLTDSKAGELDAKSFGRIRETLSKIQSLERNGVLVQGDLAPHNIFISKDKIIISDWDKYKIYADESYKMYDYATLWFWLYKNEDRLIKIYKSNEYPAVYSKGQLNNFKKHYTLILKEKLKLSDPHLNRGRKLRKIILESFAR